MAKYFYGVFERKKSILDREKNKKKMGDLLIWFERKREKGNMLSITVENFFTDHFSYKKYNEMMESGEGALQFFFSLYNQINNIK